MRILHYALKNIIRNSFLSFSTVLVVSLMVFFINILAFQLYTAEHLIKQTNERLVISLYLRNGLSNENTYVQELMGEIHTTFPKVHQSYISNVEALNTIKERDPKLADLVETGSENPLPNSIKLTKISMDDRKILDHVIERYRDIVEYDKTDTKNMVSYRDQINQIEPTISLLRSIQYGMYTMICLFFITVFIILYNVVGNFIFFYRDEMKIIMLVGGSSLFIYWPFAIQSWFYGFFGASLATILTFLLFWFMNFQEYTGFVRGFLDVSLPYLITEVGVFLIIGVVSGFFASRKYIRHIRESVHDA